MIDFPCSLNLSQIQPSKRLDLLTTQLPQAKNVVSIKRDESNRLRNKPKLFYSQIPQEGVVQGVLIVPKKKREFRETAHWHLIL